MHCHTSYIQDESISWPMAEWCRMATNSPRSMSSGSDWIVPCRALVLLDHGFDSKPTTVALARRHRFNLHTVNYRGTNWSSIQCHVLEASWKGIARHLSNTIQFPKVDNTNKASCKLSRSCWSPKIIHANKKWQLCTGVRCLDEWVRVLSLAENLRTVNICVWYMHIDAIGCNHKLQQFGGYWWSHALLWAMIVLTSAAPRSAARPATPNCPTVPEDFNPVNPTGTSTSFLWFLCCFDCNFAGHVLSGFIGKRVVQLCKGCAFGLP